MDRGDGSRRRGGDSPMKSFWRIAVAVLMATATALTCGPFISDVLPVETVRPGNLDAYANRGEIGIVRPHFARRYLVQAYRRMSGREPLPAVGRLPPFFDEEAQAAQEKWSEMHERILGSAPPLASHRNIGDYQFIVNCLAGAYTAAAKTLAERVAGHGAGSAEVREWLKAQDQVFENS